MWCGSRRFRCLGALLLLAGASPAEAVLRGSVSRDPNGVRASVVKVETSRGELCSGTLIAPDQVLTAAHCIIGGGQFRVVGVDRRPFRDKPKDIEHHQVEAAVAQDLKGRHGRADRLHREAVGAGGDEHVRRLLGLGRTVPQVFAVIVAAGLVDVRHGTGSFVRAGVNGGSVQGNPRRASGPSPPARRATESQLL